MPRVSEQAEGGNRNTPYPLTSSERADAMMLRVVRLLRGGLENITRKPLSGGLHVALVVRHPKFAPQYSQYRNMQSTRARR